MAIDPEGLTVTELIDCLNGTPIQRKEHRDPLIPKYYSEYQAAYKAWPWQPIQQSCKPLPPKKITDKINKMQRKTTYSIDYTFHEAQRQPTWKRHRDAFKRSMKAFDSKTTYKQEFYAKKLHTPEDIEEPIQVPPVQKVLPQSVRSKFDGLSMYTASYPAYDKKTIAICNQGSAKVKESADNLIANDFEKKSTAKDEMVQRENVDRSEPETARKETTISTDPAKTDKEYKESFIDPFKDAYMTKIPIVEERPYKFDAITTAMADYTAPSGIQRRKPYFEPKSEHFVMGEPFEDKTTFRTTYTEWPVTRSELPKWAKQPVYKRPVGGMLLVSSYMSEFQDPGLVGKEEPYPFKRNTDIIRASGDRKFDHISTYQNDYQCWEDVHAPKSYNVIETYKQPTVPMICETNQRAHFKGEQIERVQPYRLRSQHRDLNENRTMNLITTYNEFYRDFFAKSSSYNAYISKYCRAPAAPQTPKTTKISSIPVPDLSALPKVDKMPKPPPTPKPTTPPPRSPTPKQETSTSVTNKSTTTPKESTTDNAAIPYVDATKVALS